MDEVLFPDDGLLVLASGGSNANEVLLHLDASGRVLARYPNHVSDQSSRQPANAITIQPAMDGLGNIFLLNESDTIFALFQLSQI